MRIFLSYRRTDVGGYAGRLADTLVQRLGADNVFHDVSTIAAGRDFVDAILHALDQCDATLAVIGPGWLAATTPEGTARLVDPNDYVRLELGKALHRDMPVVPVLVGGARLPLSTELPEDLRPLAQRQAFEIRDEAWHQDVDHLLRSLRGQPAAPPAARRRRAAAAMVLAALVLVAVGLAWWRPWAHESDGGATVASACPNPHLEGWTSLSLSALPEGTATADAGPRVYTVREGSWRPRGPGQWEVVLKTTMTNGTGADRYHNVGDYDALIVAQHSFEPACFQVQGGGPVLPRTAGDALIGFDVTCAPDGYIELRLTQGEAGIPVTDPASPEGAC